MYTADLDTLKDKTRLSCSLFLIVGLIFVYLTEGYWFLNFLDDGEMFIALLLLSVAVTGFLSIYGYPSAVTYYVLQLTIYGGLITFAFFFNVLIALGALLAFPDCNDHTNPGCQAQKDASLALLATIAFVLTFQFFLTLQFIYTYRTAKELKEALNK